MDTVSLLLIVCAAVAVLGALGEVVHERTGLPEALWLAGCGVLLGPVLGVLQPEALGLSFSTVGALVLTFVLFEGGLRIDPVLAARVGPRALLVAGASAGTSVAITGIALTAASLLGALPPGWRWSDGLLAGVLLAAPSSRLVGRALARSAGDAGATDLARQEAQYAEVASVLGAAVVFEGKASAAIGTVAQLADVTASLSIAVVAGLVASLGMLGFLQLTRSAEHAYPIALAGMLVLYVSVGQAGGSGALSVLVCSGGLASAPVLHRVVPALRPADFEADPSGFGRLARFLARSSLFLLAGLALRGPWPALLVGIVVAILLLGSRFGALHLAMLGASSTRRATRMLGACVSRGMFPIAFVLATGPAVLGEPMTQVILSATITTIALFALLYPLARGKGARTTLVSVELPSGTTQVEVPLIVPDPSSRQAMSSEVVEVEEEPVPPTKRAGAWSEGETAGSPLPAPRPPPRLPPPPPPRAIAPKVVPPQPPAPPAPTARIRRDDPR